MMKPSKQMPPDGAGQSRSDSSASSSSNHLTTPLREPISTRWSRLRASTIKRSPRENKFSCLQMKLIVIVLIVSVNQLDAATKFDADLVKIDQFASAKEEATAGPVVSYEDDDISMINESQLDPGNQQDVPLGRGRKSNWPVDVDVDDGDGEINQYDGKQEGAPKKGLQETEEAEKTQEVQTGTRSKRTSEVTTMPGLSDGSPGPKFKLNHEQDRRIISEQDLSSRTGDNLKCRLEKDWYMDFGQYKHYSCANCYGQLPSLLFVRKLIFKKELKGLLFDEPSNTHVMTNETQLIRATFKEDRTFKIWQDCCQQAIDCCLSNSIYLPKTIDSLTGELIDDQERKDVCPATWDGLSCWPDTQAGQLAEHDCPLHVYFLEFVPICVGQVTKQCFSNGSWYVRNGHEWSDYRRCLNVDVYAQRMLIGSGLHLFSVIVIGPALLILGKMRHRFGTRRVRILRWLLFWLLLNGLFSATQKIGIIMGVFQRPPDRDHQRATSTIANQPSDSNRSSTSVLMSSSSPKTVQESSSPMAKFGRGLSKHDESPGEEPLDSWMSKLNSSMSSYERDGNGGISGEASGRNRRMLHFVSSQSSSQSVQQSSLDAKPRESQSVLIVLLCWTLSVGIKITRLFNYAWMFTSAVYLCSVLHFSPAEPSPMFMSWLMFLTHSFPLVIGTIYITVRSIYEPSPLALLFKLPYHYVRDDLDYVNHLKDTQLDCWMVTSRFDEVEIIADYPYFILVLLNTALFIITLIIMCRFKKLPGSTRPETSLWGYFKAAGMLVFLYGAHYLLLVASPKIEWGCKLNQVWHYSMLLIDGIQGVAVSLVFCYRTSAGKEVISKWWKNIQDEYDWDCCMSTCSKSGRQSKTGRHQRRLLKQNSRSNRSARSSNSNCNGKDMVTELSNVHVNNF